MERRWVACLKLALILFFIALAVSFATLTAKGAREAGANTAGPASISQPGPTPSPRFAFPELVRELRGLEVLRLQPSWELEVGKGQVKLLPDGERLYVASSTDSTGGTLYCVNARSGSVLWSRVLDGWISCSPGAREGVVYVGTTSRTLYALDAESGAMLWTFTAQGEILTPPVLDGGLLFFFADNDAVFGLSNRLYALDAGSGALLWSYDTASWTPSPPTTGHGMVFTAGSTSTVMALDMGTGREAWAHPVDSVVFSSPLLSGDRLYVATVNGRLYSLDALTGERLWETRMYDFTPSLPCLIGNNILLDRCPDRLLAFSTEGGALQWSLGGNALLAAGPPSAGTVYAYYPEGRLLELEAGTGRCLRIHVAGFKLSQRPCVSDGWAYCVSPDGVVRACPLSGGRAAD